MCVRPFPQLLLHMFCSVSTTPARLVLDTNIVMDMLHFRDARTAWLKSAITRRQVLCFSDADCLGELRRVTAYPEFGLDSASKKELLDTYLDFVIRHDAIDEGTAALPRCRDADDQKFLELAARCKADLLITRDKQLLRLDRHRHKPPPFAIVTAEKAATLLDLPAEHPANGL